MSSPSSLATRKIQAGGRDVCLNFSLYTDYLLSTFGAATATGLSAMVEGDVSHDQVTRFLSGQEYTSKDLWQNVKKTVRSVECEDGVLIFDGEHWQKP